MYSGDANARFSGNHEISSRERNRYGSSRDNLQRLDHTHTHRTVPRHLEPSDVTCVSVILRVARGKRRRYVEHDETVERGDARARGRLEDTSYPVVT